MQFVQDGVASLGGDIDTSANNCVPQTYDAVWAAAISAAAAEPGDHGLGYRAMQALRTPGAMDAFRGATLRSWRWDQNGDPDMASYEMQVVSYNRQPGASKAAEHAVATHVSEGVFHFSEDTKLVWGDGTIYPQVCAACRHHGSYDTV